MSASITDLLTAAKNIVTAINGAAQTYLNVNGTLTKNGITAATVVNTGQGRIANVSVVATSTTAGKIYDATVSSATTNPIGVIPATTGMFSWNIPYNNGIVVAPGSGQTVTISYS